MITLPLFRGIGSIWDEDARGWRDGRVGSWSEGRGRGTNLTFLVFLLEGFANKKPGWIEYRIDTIERIEMKIND